MYHVIYIYSIVKFVSLLVAVPGSTSPSPADESLHQYVEDGSTYSSIRDPLRIIWFILLGSYHDRLATYHMSGREMATRDTHVSCASGRDDDHVIRCCYHPWPSYRWPNSHWDMCARCGGVVQGASRCHPLAHALGGSAISIWWLCDQLSTPAPDADEVALERSASGFILALMGSFLFTDKKGVHVHL